MVGGATMEVTTAQFWSQLGEASLEQEIEFHGVTANPSAAFIDGSAGGIGSRASEHERSACLLARHEVAAG